MPQATVGSEDRTLAEQTTFETPSDHGSEVASPKSGPGPRGDRLRTLCAELNVAERDVAPGDSATNAADQHATRELLLDELLAQLGAWETEIARRREAQQREQQRLDARQVELDRLSAEIQEQREHVHQRQIEAEHRLAEAEGRLAAISSIEESLKTTGRDHMGPRRPTSIQSHGPRATRPSTPAAPTSPRASLAGQSVAGAPNPASTAQSGESEGPQGDSTPNTSQSSVGESRTKSAVGGLSTARFLQQLSGGATESVTQEAPMGHAAAPTSDSQRTGSGPTPAPLRQDEADVSRPQQREEAVDSSVEDYMTALLGRERKGKQPAGSPVPSAASSSPEKTDRPKPADPPKVISREPVRPAPRKTAPQVDISARMRELRDVANQSASSALKHHSRQRLVVWVQGLLIALLTSFVCGTALFWFSTSLALVVVGTAVVLAGGLFFAMNKLRTGRAGNGAAAVSNPSAGDLKLPGAGPSVPTTD